MVQTVPSVLPVSDFIHLRVHTAYSLLEGAVKIKKLTELCEKYRMPAVAMTDTNNVFGAFEMSTECAAHGIQPIIGIQQAVDMGVDEKRSFTKDPDACIDDIVLLVQNEQGYANLRMLSEQAYMFTPNDEKPHVPYDVLKKYSDGLICLTGGAGGAVGRQIQAGKTEKSEEVLKRLMEAFPQRLYMEIQRHGTEAESVTEPSFLEMAYRYDIPLVATNEVFFTDPDMFEAHDALICIKEKTHVIVNDRRRLTTEHYFKSPEEMKTLFEDIPEAVQNTVVIAKRCGFMVEKQPPALPHYPDCGDKTEAQVLQERARAGLEKRLAVHVFKENMSDAEKDALREKYTKRLEYELGIIIQMDFPGYFLIVSDFIQWSKAHGIPVGPGRGSGAGSVVAWSLTITDLDPIRFNLLFERFLNPERVSMPDFDVDFCQDRRGETICYVREKYGHERVAQIITFGKLQAKAVIRDVGRVLQMDFVADKLARLVPAKPGTTLNEAFAVEPEFDRQRKSDARVEQLLDIALKLEGLYRNASTHAAGVVVGQKPLNQIVPVYRDLSADSDLPVTQYNMKFVESTGLVKFDFLGLKTLTVIAEAVKMIRKRGIELNISEISLEDPETFELLHQAETDGVFQLESGGMRKTLRDMSPDSLEDLIALVSLYRPGPMDNIPSYIARKHGKEQPDYMHPMLEDILKETYGIMIYQEQVMQIAQKMAGYTLGAADLLRRAMGKKKKEEMELQEAVFVEGATKNGIDPQKAKSIFSRMAKFAEYGFNKSHAAAYALIAYQTAYLKAHYPVEFMAATMTYDMQNTDKLALYKKELGRLNIELLAPDINHSFVPFSVENNAVRYALMAVKGAGEAPAKAVVEEREKNGMFKSMTDFIRRMDSSNLDKKTLETWIKAGVFDSLEKNRGLLHANLDLLMKHARVAGEEKNSSQINLFGQQTKNEKIIMAPAPAWTLDEKLKMESAVIGFYLSAHPLERYAKSLERLRTMSYMEMSRSVSQVGSLRVKMAVTVTAVHERMSKKGSKYAFVSASDTSGSFEFTVFADGLNHYRDVLKSGKPLLATFNAEKEEGAEAPRLILQRVEFLDDVVSKTAGGIMIFIENKEAVNIVKELMSTLNAGNSRILFVVHIDKWEVEISCERTYTLTTDFLSSLQKIPGITEVQEL